MGQKTNRAKTPQEVKDTTKTILKISKEGGVGKYLGLPEHFGRKKKDLFTSVVEESAREQLAGQPGSCQNQEN